jgi:hypothetical protein
MLKDFCACPYWDRLWIAQEIVPAKKISLSCDSSICSWRLITAFCYHYFDGPLLTISGLRRRFSPRVCWFIEHKFQRGNTSYWKSYPSIDDLLAEFLESKCQGTKDTVYALQDMLDPDHQVLVDYGKPIEEVFVIERGGDSLAWEDKWSCCRSLCSKMMPEVGVLAI